MRLRDLYPYSKAKLRAASPLGEATGATRRNKSFREFLRKSYYLFRLIIDQYSSVKHFSLLLPLRSSLRDAARWRWRSLL